MLRIIRAPEKSNVFGQVRTRELGVPEVSMLTTRPQKLLFYSVNESNVFYFSLGMMSGSMYVWYPNRNACTLLFKVRVIFCDFNQNREKIYFNIS